VFEMFRREIIALNIMVLVPATGLVVNLIWPPEQHGYIVEMSLLLVLALGAMWLSFHAPRMAMLLYSTFALLPVGAMLEYWMEISDGFSVLALIPVLGIWMVAFATRHYLTTLIYGIIAFCASAIYGNIDGDLGQAGALVFVSALVTFWALRWVECTGVHIRGEYEKLQREVQEIRGMTSVINQQMEALNHDP